MDSSDRKADLKARLEFAGELFVAWLWVVAYLLAELDFVLLMLKQVGAL